ncbi:hypothetical protein QBC41DRAFT_65036 [Cercophora samala]|uniref:Uncharacterized protein n=1 Tax=Cercophora samala TaxID=330535 RepID=A0AA39ZH59_9PEZI|nr:hypothetical protein QBC41DRAFT_65036 [Cercophora samala]
MELCSHVPVVSAVRLLTIDNKTGRWNDLDVPITKHSIPGAKGGHGSVVRWLKERKKNTVDLSLHSTTQHDGPPLAWTMPVLAVLLVHPLWGGFCLAARIACAVRYARGRRHNKRARHAVVLEKDEPSDLAKSLEALGAPTSTEDKISAICILLRLACFRSASAGGGRRLQPDNQTPRLTHLWIPRKKKRREMGPDRPCPLRASHVRLWDFTQSISIISKTGAGQFHHEFQKQMLMC